MEDKMGCDIHMYIEKKDKEKGQWEAVDYSDDIDVGRDYDLFCFLAGVRCGEEPQHFERKGLPDDLSPEVREECEGWGSDGHSHSWLTLEELQTVNWEDDKAMIRQSGIMANYQWEKFEETIKKGKPDYSIIKTYWQAGGDPETSSYHEWNYPMKLEFKTFYVEVVKRLQNECKKEEDCKPSDIRIVFWFDN